METPTASTSTAQSDDIAIGSTDIRDANGVSHTAAASLIFAPADCGPAQEAAAFASRHCSGWLRNRRAVL